MSALTLAAKGFGSVQTGDLRSKAAGCRREAKKSPAEAVLD
jgi:hypothetical protein